MCKHRSFDSWHTRPLGRSVAGPPEALSDDEAFFVFGSWMVMGRTIDELNPATVQHCRYSTSVAVIILFQPSHHEAVLMSRCFLAGSDSVIS